MDMLKFFLKMDYLKLISKNFKMPNIKCQKYFTVTGNSDGIASFSKLFI